MGIDPSIYHPFLVHFPVVLFLLATACAIVSAIVNKQTVLLDVSVKRCLFYISHVLVILGALALIPTVLSGWIASWRLSEDNTTLISHQRWAYFTLAVSLIHAALRLNILFQYRYNAGMLIQNRLLALLICNTVLVLWTADFGGALTHGRGFFHFTSPSVTEVLTPYHDAPLVSHLHTPEIETYLSKQIEVVQVKPLFEKYGCIECHAEHFSNGYPIHFSTGDNPRAIWITRDANGEVTNLETSEFYQTVILNNRMPLDESGESIGILPCDRLVLLEWLKNGAPGDKDFE